MKDRLRVLEAVGAYLYDTENWIYRLINNVPDTDIVIASKQFLKCDYYSNEFEYLEFPLRKIDASNQTFAAHIYNAFVAAATASSYTRYLKDRTRDIDLIHSHFANVGWGYTGLAKRLSVPHIVSLYGSDYDRLYLKNRISRKRYERLLKQVDLFLCEGRFGAKALQRMGCPPNKTVVQKLGVDVDSIPFFKREKKSKELTLLQVATLTGKKGHIYTVEAFVEALKNCPNMALTVVGKDVEGIKAQLQTIIQRHEAQNKVTFRDWIDLNTLHAFMEDYQVFIHPSCYTVTRDCEGGAPVVFLDAQATGMPIIATTHCDIPEEVIHNQTGLLTPEKDIRGLVNSIKYFYELDQRTYDTFCANARKHICQNYDCKQNAKQLKTIYDSCI